MQRTELLLEKGYEVHGIIRRSSSFNTGRLQHLYEDQHERAYLNFRPCICRSRFSLGPTKFHLHYGDLSDSTNLVYILASVQPSEVYNLGAQSHVKVSFEMAEYTVCSTLYLLVDVVSYADAIRGMLMASARFVCLMPFVPVGSRNSYASIKHLPRNSTAKSSRHLSRRQPPFTRVLHMELQNSMRSGLRSTIGRHTACMPAMGSYSTMKAHVVAELS
jgi:GDP-mannose 4,6-dehydratase